jgi:hypothetical protein
MKTIKQIIGKSVLGATIIAAFFFTFSCSQESDAYATNELIGVKAKIGKEVTRPVRITLEGMDNEDGPGGTITGKMTHLGKITGINAGNEVYELIEGGLKSRTIAGGKDIIYAANGDEVWATNDLTIIFTSETTAIYTGLITFVGGTGRFEDASGFMEIENGDLEVIGLKTDGVTPITAISHVGNGEITY